MRTRSLGIGEVPLLLVQLKGAACTLDRLAAAPSDLEHVGQITELVASPSEVRAIGDVDSLTRQSFPGFHVAQLSEDLAADAPPHHLGCEVILGGPLFARSRPRLGFVVGAAGVQHFAQRRSYRRRTGLISHLYQEIERFAERSLRGLTIAGRQFHEAYREALREGDRETKTEVLPDREALRQVSTRILEPALERFEPSDRVEHPGFEPSVPPELLEELFAPTDAFLG